MFSSTRDPASLLFQFVFVVEPKDAKILNLEIVRDVAIVHRVAAFQTSAEAVLKSLLDNAALGDIVCALTGDAIDAARGCLIGWFEVVTGLQAGGWGNRSVIFFG